MKKKSPSGNRASFLIIAVMIMLFVDQFILRGERPYMEAVKQEGLFTSVAEEERQKRLKKKAEEKIDKKKKSPRMGPFLGISSDTSQPIITDFTEIGRNIPVHRVDLPEDRPLWKKNAVKVYPPSDWPKVAILIDDMGMDVKRSTRVMNLPGPLTLSFLPYARNVKGLARDGRDSGHELMVHMPMEPMNGKLDMGAIALNTKQSPDDFVEMLDKGLDVFDGYVGINNHMGSKLTQDKEAMARVMDELYDRGLLFVDSRTIETSVAAEIAGEHGVPYAVRDVFLDHESTPEFVSKSLERLEYIARYNGYAIAIGHPKDATITALRAWLPTLKEKKIALVPVSMIVEERLRRLSDAATVPVKESSLPQKE